MAHKIQISSLADAVMDELREYASLATEDVKAAVKDAADTVKKDIQSSAPRHTGTYAKSWAVKNTMETANSLTLTVHSKNRYQLAHLLEHGHAKRNGGRTAAQPHIAPAEQKGIEQLEQDIKKALEG